MLIPLNYPPPGINLIFRKRFRSLVIPFHVCKTVKCKALFATKCSPTSVLVFKFLKVKFLSSYWNTWLPMFKEIWLSPSKLLAMYSFTWERRSMIQQSNGGVFAVERFMEWNEPIQYEDNCKWQLYEYYWLPFHHNQLICHHHPLWCGLQFSTRMWWWYIISMPSRWFPIAKIRLFSKLCKGCTLFAYQSTPLHLSNVLPGHLVSSSMLPSKKMFAQLCNWKFWIKPRCLQPHSLLF